MASHFKQFIGDGVYADFDGQNVVLTTENGIATTNRIVLEPQVWDSLDKWWQWTLQTLYMSKHDDTGTAKTD